MESTISEAQAAVENLLIRRMKIDLCCRLTRSQATVGTYGKRYARPLLPAARFRLRFVGRTCSGILSITQVPPWPARLGPDRPADTSPTPREGSSRMSRSEWRRTWWRISPGAD